MAAVLAGGLVLGVGAATTLAAWTSSQYAQSSVGTSIFALESTVDATGSTGWADYPQGAAAQLNLDAAALSPGARKTASFLVRTTSASTVGGALVPKLALVPTSKTGSLPSYLQYSLESVSIGTSCASRTIASGAWRAMDADPVITGNQQVQAARGNLVKYCLDLRMVADNVPSSVQGATVGLTLTVTGSSE
ncbi:hypothetical protein [Glutamicibacter sp. X7]